MKQKVKIDPIVFKNRRRPKQSKYHYVVFRKYTTVTRFYVQMANINGRNLFISKNKDGEFLTEKEAAFIVDRILIENGYEPVNILKPVKQN